MIEMTRADGRQGGPGGATAEEGGGKHGYDEDRLVEMLVERRKTHQQIAAELGISESLVKKISCGLKRPELQKKMWDVENGLTGDARRLGANYARALIARQIQLGLDGKGDQARRAREFVLQYLVKTRPDRDKLPLGPECPTIERDLELLSRMAWEDWGRPAVTSAQERRNEMGRANATGERGGRG